MDGPIQDLSPRISDCLKVIYTMQERGQKVSTSAVSERLGVSDATVTMLFKDFAAAGWGEHVPYHGRGRTPPGGRKGLAGIRHHPPLRTDPAGPLASRWGNENREAAKTRTRVSRAAY